MRRSSTHTKAAILDAARQRFAADGYDRTTIRAIADAAGIDPSMVMRYFGSKQHLFACAADMDLQLPDLVALPPDRVGWALAAHIVDRWEVDDALQILLRTAMTTDESAERMRGIFAAQLVPMITELTGDPGQAPARAGLAASQALGLALCRYVLRFPPLVDLSRDAIVEWLGPTLQRYLVGSP
ncbi:TetR family transcriptional regulator [Nocardia sp. CNY236]|uniref:TetR/AcrR family transcriptional regulator n=1 Tax=Nocardia sp. CNY236 TaxID=1169152 RepID=UPI0004901DBC|nr:TetR family transcriptional regulator [Nocardia sp. CNY236]